MDDTSSAVHAETRQLAAIVFTDIVGFSRQMGSDEARMLRIVPHFSLETLRQSFPFKDPAVLERELDALCKAGLK